MQRQDFDFDSIKQKINLLRGLATSEISSKLKEIEGEITYLELPPFQAEQLESLLKPFRKQVKKDRLSAISISLIESQEPKNEDDKKSTNFLSPQITMPEKATGKSKIETILTDPKYSGQTVTYEELENKSIFVLVNLEALSLVNLKNCKIYVLGCISASLFIRECKDCEVHARAKQVRIFKTIQTNLFISAITEPIIELSKNLGFGPYSLRSCSLAIPETLEFGESQALMYRIYLEHIPYFLT